MPLTYRDRGNAKSGTQLDIMCGNAELGRLWKQVLSGVARGEECWTWSWDAGPASGPQQHGTADNIDAAKMMIEAEWRAWLEAAGLQERTR